MKPQPWDTSGMRTLRKPPRSASSVPPSARRDSGSRRLVSDRPESASGTVDARSGGRRANESRGRLGGLRGAVRDLRAAAAGFLRGERAVVAIESAIALMVLVVGFGGLMEIVQASYTDDRMGRAARAAARALALDPSDPSANACAAIRREFHLARASTAMVRHGRWNRTSASLPVPFRPRSTRVSRRVPATWSSSGSAGAAMSGRSTRPCTM